MSQTVSDEFELYDLRVEVIETGKPFVMHARPGDTFDVIGGRIVFPSGREASFSLYAMLAVLPFIPAKQRPTHPNDWMTTDTEIASRTRTAVPAFASRVWASASFATPTTARCRSRPYRREIHLIRLERAQGLWAEDVGARRAARASAGAFRPTPTYASDAIAGSGETSGAQILRDDEIQRAARGRRGPADAAVKALVRWPGRTRCRAGRDAVDGTRW